MADLNQEDKVFAASTNKTGIGTTELPVLFIKNPSGSGITANLRGIVVGNTHTVSSWVRFRVYSNPTTSADGTAVTRATMDIGSGKTATCTAFNTPTVSANGSLLLDVMAAYGSGASLVFPPGCGIRANNTLLVTAVSDGAGRPASVSLFWDED